MSDDGITIEIFSLDAVIRKLYALPTIEDLGEYIPSNIIMFDILEYAKQENIISVPHITLESIGLAISRVLNPKTKHIRAMTRGMKTTRYLLVRLDTMSQVSD